MKEHEKPCFKTGVYYCLIDGYVLSRLHCDCVWKSVASSVNVIFIQQAGKWGVLVMTPTFPLITEMALKKSTPEAVYDRAYRIRHNKGQVRN